MPLAGAIAQLSWIKGHPIAAFFVRKKPKEHGARTRGGGPRKGESLQGKRIVIVEDVTTTGGSALKAVRPCATPAARSCWCSPWSTATKARPKSFAEAGSAVSLALQGRRVSEGVESLSGARSRARAISFSAFRRLLIARLPSRHYGESR